MTTVERSTPAYDALPPEGRTRVDAATTYMVGKIEGKMAYRLLAGTAVTAVDKIMATFSLTREQLGIALERTLAELKSNRS